jgi:hypothetical protein
LTRRCKVRSWPFAKRPGYCRCKCGTKALAPRPGLIASSCPSRGQTPAKWSAGVPGTSGRHGRSGG